MVRSLKDVSGELTRDGDYTLADDRQLTEFIKECPQKERGDLKEILRAEAQRLIDEKIRVDEAAIKGSVYSPLYRAYLRDFLEIDILNDSGSLEFMGKTVEDLHGTDFSKIQRGSKQHYVLERKNHPHSFTLVIPQSVPDPEASSP